MTELNSNRDFNIPVGPDGEAKVYTSPMEKDFWERRNARITVDIVEYCKLYPWSNDKRLGGIFKKGRRFGLFLSRNADKVWLRGLLDALQESEVQANSLRYRKEEDEKTD